MIRCIAPVCHEEVKPWCYWSWTILKVSMIVVVASSHGIWCAVCFNITVDCTYKDNFFARLDFESLKTLAITWASTSLMCWGSQVHTWVCFKPRKWSLNILTCFLCSFNKQQGKNKKQITNYNKWVCASSLESGAWTSCHASCAAPPSACAASSRCEDLWISTCPKRWHRASPQMV